LLILHHPPVFVHHYSPFFLHHRSPYTTVLPTPPLSLHHRSPYTIDIPSPHHRWYHLIIAMDPPPYQNFFSDPPESPPDWDKMEAEGDAAAKPVDPWPKMPEVTHDPALVKRLWDENAARAARVSELRSKSEDFASKEKSASDKDNVSDQADNGDKKKPGAVKSHIGPEMATEEGRLPAAQMPPDAQK
ncbi:hypothetical protein CMUS01_08927, partial [Colletotrichum musicola]